MEILFIIEMFAVLLIGILAIVQALQISSYKQQIE